MAQFKNDIIIFAGLLTLLSIVLLLTADQSTIDFQLHDTYFVLDKISMTVLIAGPLMFLIFLIRGLMRRFKAPGANVGLIIGLILIVFITYRVIWLQESFLKEMMGLDDEGVPDSGSFIADAKNKIRWAWGLLGLWATGLLILTYRTVKVWKSEK